MPRWPPIDVPPREGSNTAPGVSSTKSWNRRPLIGSELIAVSLIDAACWLRVTSTSGASDVTVTVSWTVATFIVRGCVSVSPTRRIRPSRLSVAKPWSCAVSS